MNLLYQDVYKDCRDARVPLKEMEEKIAACYEIFDEDNDWLDCDDCGQGKKFTREKLSRGWRG